MAPRKKASETKASADVAGPQPREEAALKLGAIEPKDYTFARVPETPEQKNVLLDVLRHFEQSLLRDPLPLEWLTHSLHVGAPLDDPRLQ